MMKSYSFLPLKYTCLVSLLQYVTFNSVGFLFLGLFSEFLVCFVFINNLHLFIMSHMCSSY